MVLSLLPLPPSSPPFSPPLKLVPDAFRKLIQAGVTSVPVIDPKTRKLVGFLDVADIAAFVLTVRFPPFSGVSRPTNLPKTQRKKLENLFTSPFFLVSISPHPHLQTEPLFVAGQSDSHILAHERYRNVLCGGIVNFSGRSETDVVRFLPAPFLLPPTSQDELDHERELSLDCRRDDAGEEPPPVRLPPSSTPS